MASEPAKDILTLTLMREANKICLNHFAKYCRVCVYNWKKSWMKVIQVSLL